MSGTAPTDAMQYLGEICHLARKVQGRTLREVAAMAQTSQSYLWEIEHGNCAPSFVLVVRLCSVLDIDIRGLADGVWLKLTNESGAFHEK